MFSAYNCGVYRAGNFVGYLCVKPPKSLLCGVCLMMDTPVMLLCSHGVCTDVLISFLQSHSTKHRYSGRGTMIMKSLLLVLVQYLAVGICITDIASKVVPSDVETSVTSYASAVLAFSSEYTTER